MAAVEIVTTELTIDARPAEDGARAYARAMEVARSHMERTLAISSQLAESYSQQARVSREVVAANDNTSKSIAGTAGEVLELGSKLKTLATVAYLTWPAFRNGVNLQALPALKLLHVGLSEVAPVATAAGTAMLRSFAPVFAFLSKIALPILAIVVAWKALNALIGHGADLLEKYGNAGRSFDSPNLAANLEKLTKLQPKDDNVTAAQAREAAELNTRLDQAKFKLGEALDAQINLNAAALDLQRIWVNIVEQVAKYATAISNLGPPDPGLEQLIKDTGYQASGKSDIDERFAAIRDARRRLSAAMGIAAAGADADANIGDTFPAQWNVVIDVLAKARKETAEVKGEFDRLYRSMERAAAVQEAESKAVGESIGEHARLRAEMRLLETAQQDIAKNKKDIEEYTDRIKKLSDRIGEAAQKAAELNAASKLKFEVQQLGVSPVEGKAQAQLRRIYGDDTTSDQAEFFGNQIKIVEALRQTSNAESRVRDGFEELQTTLNKAAEDPLLLKSLGMTTADIAKIKAALGEVSAAFQTTMEKAQAANAVALKAITAFSPAAKADIAYLQAKAQLQEQVKSQAISAEDAETLAIEAKNLALRQSAVTISEQARERLLSAQQGVQSARDEIDTIGKTVGERERLRADLQTYQHLYQESARNRTAFDWGEYERLRKINAERGKLIQQAAELNLKSDIKFTGDTLFLSDTDKQIASILRQVHGADWKNMMDGPIASAMRFNILLRDTVDTVREIGQTIAGSIVRSLMDGTNVMDGLSNALKNLSARLADKAIEALLSGDFAKAAVAGISAAVTFIGSKLTNREDEKRLEEAKKKFADMAAEVRNFNVAADGFELSQFVTAIQQITRTGLELVKAAMAAGDVAAAVQLIHAGVRQINNTVDQFIRPRGDTVPEQIANENAQAKQLIAELDAVNRQFGLGLNRTPEIIAATTAHIDEILRKAQAEIDARILSFQDRAFNAANDNTTLEGQLAAQARQFERERLEETKTGGEAMVDLLAAQQAEELALRRNFNDKAIEETKRAEQERLDAINGAGRNITEFLNSLVSGPNATVSPIDNYVNSRALYNANYGLALGGDIDAQNKFAQLGRTFLDSSRAVNASGSAFQADFQQVLSQGLALPAVQQATDPFVIEMRNVLAAINAGNATQALDATLQNVIKSAIDAGNAAAIAALLVPKFDTLTATTGGTLNFAQFVAGLGPQYANVATGVAVGGLLTQSQLTALGLSRDTTTGALLTSTQLQAAGLASNSTVGGLLTQSQISALGLSTNSTVDQVRTAVGAMDTGNLLNIFRELDGNGNGILERSELIAASAQATSTNTAGIATVVTNTNGIATIATNTGSLSSIATNTGGISTVASNTGTTAYNSWGLAMLEPIQTHINSVATNTGSLSQIATSTGDIQSVATNTANLQQIATSVGGSGVIATRLSDGSTLITNTGNTADYSNTAKQQLQLLNQQLSGSTTVITGNPTTAGGTGIVTEGTLTLDNTLLEGVQKLVFNTGKTVESLKVLISNQFPNAPTFVPLYAAGGWITGGIPGRDSVPVMAMPDEYLVRADATRALTTQFGAGIMDTINAGRLPANVIPFPTPMPSFRGGANDNSALLAEIRRLNDKIDRLEKVVAGSGANVARAVVETGEKQIGAAKEHTQKTTAEMRMVGRRASV